MALDGKYYVVVQTMMGDQNMTVTLKTQGDSLSGMIDGFFGSQSFDSGKVYGNEFSWSVNLQSPMGVMKLDVNGTFADDMIKGQVVLGSFRPTPFTGKRIS
jgi:hypothetical protein